MAARKHSFVIGAPRVGLVITRRHTDAYKVVRVLLIHSGAPACETARTLDALVCMLLDRHLLLANLLQALRFSHLEVVFTGHAHL